MSNKKTYERAVLAVVCFEQTDIITTSGGVVNPGGPIVLPEVEIF